MLLIINCDKFVIFGTNAFYCKTTSEEEETNKKKFNYNSNVRDYKTFFLRKYTAKSKEKI